MGEVIPNEMFERRRREQLLRRVREHLIQEISHIDPLNTELLFGLEGATEDTSLSDIGVDADVWRRLDLDMVLFDKRHVNITLEQLEALETFSDLVDLVDPKKRPE